MFVRLVKRVLCLPCRAPQQETDRQEETLNNTVSPIAAAAVAAVAQVSTAAPTATYAPLVNSHMPLAKSVPSKAAQATMNSSAIISAYDIANESHRVESAASPPAEASRHTCTLSKPSGEVLTVLAEVSHTAPKSPLLFEALWGKNWDLAETLISENHGLLYISNTHNGITVLHAAVLAGAPIGIVRMLLERGADPNKANNWKRSPLYIAARHNVSRETMRLLVLAGGDLNQTDQFRYTPLMASSFNGAALSLIGGMLLWGANMDATDSYGKRAINWAEEGEHPEIATYLGNIRLIEAMCSAYIPRLGAKSALRLFFKKDLMRPLRDMLCIPTRPIPPKRPIVYEG